jgi:HAD superfamily hydrolase (TIGR01490 family)
MQIAAFFDMDRTLLSISTGTAWVRYLRRRGELGALELARMSLWSLKYRLALLDMEQVATRVVGGMKGGSEAELIEKTRAFFQEVVLPAVSDRARRRVEDHRRSGHLLAILSSSTPYITEPLARHLGMDHVLCTRLHVKEGRFAGTCDRPTCYGAGKVHHAERFAADHGVDLEKSYFYTDSYSDLPMLLRVGQARVVNPDARLRRHARRVGWEIETW